MPQTLGLFPHLTLAGQLRFAVGWNADLARRWIDRLGLRGLERRLPAALSLGQQQRVALARAFCRTATVLLLDEPFSAFDTPLRAQLRRELRALQNDVDATTILVTHDPEEAFLLADELLILSAGQVLQAGSVASVFARPASGMVARLLGAENIATGWMVAADRIDLGNGVHLAVAGPALPVAARVGWSVRADDIKISASGCYTGTVMAVGVAAPGRCHVDLSLGNCAVRATFGTGEQIEPGPCHVSIHPAAVQIWTLQEC